MRYAAEYWRLVAVALVLLSILIYIGYRPQTEVPGDDTPIEHDAGGEPPPDVRQP